MNALPCDELRIRGFRKMPELKAVAAHLGITVNDFVKTKMCEIIAAYPEYVRKPNQE